MRSTDQILCVRLILGYASSYLNSVTALVLSVVAFTRLADEWETTVSSSHCTHEIVFTVSHACVCVHLRLLTARRGKDEDDSKGSKCYDEEDVQVFMTQATDLYDISR